MKQKRLLSGTIHYRQTGNFVWGFSEKMVDPEDIKSFTQSKLIKQLIQTHSDNIFPSSLIQAESEGDGIILDERDTLVIIRTADCLPLFFFDKSGRTGGILHCGWRGLAQQIEKKLLSILSKTHSIHPEDLIFYFGPHICGSCYEVGPELVVEFKDSVPSNKFFIKKSKKFLLDLQEKIFLTLTGMGVLSERIQSVGVCNFEDSRFNSYRREGQNRGRIYNFISHTKTDYLK